MTQSGHHSRITEYARTAEDKNAETGYGASCWFTRSSICTCYGCHWPGYRRGGARHWRRSLSLFLSACDHGGDAGTADQSGGGARIAWRTDEPFCQHSGASHGGNEGGGAAQFRYALFERLARFDQGAGGRFSPGHRRTLLSPAYARHVERCVRLAGLAHHGNASRKFPRHTPGWNGTAPDGFTQIKAPTPYVWIIGRTKTDGPADYDAVHKIQAGYKITPLSQWGKEPVPPVVKIDPAIDMKTSPKVTVDTMKAGPYFARAAELLNLHPPHITDQPIIARLERIGFEVGKGFDLNAADPAIQKGLESAPEDAQKLMQWKIPTMARVANGWSMNTDTMGVYGNYYLKRAMIAQVGLGANLPEDAIYPLNLADSEGNPLNGANTYTIHFDKGEAPPAQAFWSITLYDPAGFQVANSINRFAVSSWMPFKYNPDGSLDLYFQNESPGADKETNWLPAPTGPYNLTMRVYAPKSDALTGKWNPPPVVKVQTVPVAAQ